MTEDQIELGRHALGLPNKQGTSYRNHFCAGPGDDDYPAWMAMVADGNALHRPGSELSGGYDVFFLTARGANRCLQAKERLSTEDFPVRANSRDKQRAAASSSQSPASGTGGKNG